MAKSKQPKKLRAPKQRVLPTTEPAKTVYSLRVSIIQGPITEAFAKANPVLQRVIQIRGNQTLAAFHEAIFDAFGRDDEHLYMFEVGGKQPFDPNARRYQQTSMMGEPLDVGPDFAGDVRKVTIAELGLAKGDFLFYWFDFGDDWWHVIDVDGFSDPDGKKYPRVVERVGKNPPQYIDWDEESDEGEEDEDDDDR